MNAERAAETLKLSLRAPPSRAYERSLMPSNRGRQKQLEKQKKRRESARKAVAVRPVVSLHDRILRMAAAWPNGPTFVSAGWNEEVSPPPLVTVVTTKLAPDGTVLPATALVDRTYLGVKNAFVAQPLLASELKGFLARVADAHGGIEEIDRATGLSIVHHAIDYARSLGFEPHPDFPASLFGPRPEPLLDTPFGKPERPLYISGPNDDFAAIAKALEQSGARISIPPAGADLVETGWELPSGEAEVENNNPSAEDVVDDDAW
jgi:hypothetical protein